MNHARTNIIRRHKLGDPVLVPAVAAFGALVVVLGLGAAVGWLAGRGASAAPPAPVVVEKRCPPPAPEPSSDPPLSPVPAAPVAPVSAPAAPAAAAVPAAHPARPARVRVARVAQVTRTALAGGDGWEPARM